MKKQLKLAKKALVLATGAALAVSSQLAGAVTQEMAGRVAIEPRDLSTLFQSAINFGNIKVGPEGGTITVSNDHSQNFTVTGDVLHVDGGYEGRLAIKGEQNHTVTVTVDSSFVISAQNITGASDLTVTSLPESGTYTLQAANGEWNYFHIGGTMTIPANQPADVYRGTFNATVNYQ